MHQISVTKVKEREKIGKEKKRKELSVLTIINIGYHFVLIMHLYIKNIYKR